MRPRSVHRRRFLYHRHLAPKVDLLEATRRRVPSRVRRSMTGAHAAAIGLESIDIMCTVTSTPLARSRVAFVPTGTGCTGTRAAPQTCSAALVWLTGKALEWLPTLWHTVVTLPKDTIYEIGPDVQIGQTKGKLRSRFTAFVSAILDRLVGRRPSGPRECAQKVETCFFQYLPLIRPRGGHDEPRISLWGPGGTSRGPLDGPDGLASKTFRVPRIASHTRHFLVPSRIVVRPAPCVCTVANKSFS